MKLNETTILKDDIDIFKRILNWILREVEIDHQKVGREVKEKKYRNFEEVYTLQ